MKLTHENINEALCRIGYDVESGQDIVIDAINHEEYLGFCISCGSDQYNVEPDARQYRCECCGKRSVYGAEEILLYFA